MYCSDEPALQINRILFWLSYYQTAQFLNEKDRLRFYESIMEYAFFGWEPDYMEEGGEEYNAIKIAFSSVRHQLDTSIQNTIRSDKNNEIKKQKKEEEELREKAERQRRIDELRKQAKETEVKGEFYEENEEMTAFAGDRFRRP